jgi:hypothetical protein
MYGMSNGDWIFMLIIVGIIGHAAIEAVLWVLSHLTWAWN